MAGVTTNTTTNTTTTITTANKINGESEEEGHMSSNSNFNLVKRVNYNVQTRVDEDEESNFSENRTPVDPFAFLTNRTNNLTTFLTNNKNYLSNNGVLSTGATTTATPISFAQ